MKKTKKAKKTEWIKKIPDSLCDPQPLGSVASVGLGTLGRAFTVRFDKAGNAFTFSRLGKRIPFDLAAERSPQQLPSRG